MNTHQYTPIAASLANQINDLKDVLTADEISVLMLTLATCANYKPPVNNCKGVTDKNCGYLSNCNSPCNKCGQIHDGSMSMRTESTDQGSVTVVTSGDQLVKLPENMATQVAFDYRPYEAVCRGVEKLLKRLAETTLIRPNPTLIKVS